MSHLVTHSPIPGVCFLAEAAKGVCETPGPPLSTFPQNLRRIPGEGERDGAGGGATPSASMLDRSGHDYKPPKGWLFLGHPHPHASNSSLSVKSWKEGFTRTTERGDH